MADEIDRNCDQHTDRTECLDCLVHYSGQFREYGILLHDGPDAYLPMRFCPFCGKKLPESLRDRWFDELNRMGIDPEQGEIPEPYRSSRWWLVKAN